MKILNIETSCDDTAISILEVKGGTTNASFKVLANNSNSQIQVHIPYGGVYPVLAKREHAKNLPIILEASLKEASPRLRRIHPSPSKIDGEGAGGEEKPPVDLIAVTYGPGLEMCLWEGIIFAQNLAKKWNVPLIPVNHMEGHVLSVFGKNKGTFKIPKIKTPILTLLVSGGHTQLVFSEKPASTRTSLGGWMQYEIIGETVDDAVGEAFDKVARMLELPYPGGPQISKLAEEARTEPREHLIPLLRGGFCNQKTGWKNSSTSPAVAGTPQEENFKFSLPRPMLHSKDFNFSYSGLKTAVFYLIRDLGGIEKIDQATRAKIALEFENAAIECLVYKTKKAMEKYKANTLIVAGGVACNTHLQREMKKITTPSPSLKRRGGIKIYFPPKGLAGDNSLMIGIAGYLNYIKNKKKIPKPSTIKATGNLRH